MVMFDELSRRSAAAGTTARRAAVRERLVPNPKGALLLGVVPEDFVVAVGVEGRVNVNQIHAGGGQLGELFQIVAAINDAGVEEGGRFQVGGRTRHSVRAV